MLQPQNPDTHTSLTRKKYSMGVFKNQAIQTDFAQLNLDGNSRTIDIWPSRPTKNVSISGQVFSEMLTRSHTIAFFEQHGGGD